MGRMKIAGIAVLLCGAAYGADANQLAFFTGCWAFTRPDGGIVEEMWNKPSGGTLSGTSRTVRGGRTVAAEFLQIREEKGVLTYFAQPKFGGPVTPFAAIRVTEDEVVFENPEHDFPQRIIYRRQPDGLAARIEGKQNGREGGSNFPYKRVKCD